MVTSFKAVFLELFRPPAKRLTDVDHLTLLQKQASASRADYAYAKEQAAMTRQVAVLAAVAPCRKRMQEAETRYMVALQVLENRNSRQRSY